jgi:hypothetical protein
MIALLCSPDARIGPVTTLDVRRACNLPADVVILQPMRHTSLQ